MHKTLIKLRFVKINPREKPTGSQLAKSNPREMLKKMTRENKSKRKFLSLRQNVTDRMQYFKKGDQRM